MTIESSPAATSVPSTRAHALRGLCAGAVHLPGDPGYDEARMPWNVAVDQRPAAVAYPANADEVADVVRAAADAGLRVAPQGTGHNAGPLGDLSRTVLLRTSAMTGVDIDPERRIARVEAGVLWLDVVEAAAAYGLAALHGSSPDVGVVGYTLGGGMGWYARRHGLAANHVTAVELVLGDGSQVRATADEHPDLFWAVRGGGGNFGVVTALELRLFPIESAYAGMLMWDQAHAERVLRTWVAWTETAPESVTTSFRMLNLPPLPELPPFLRGRQLVVIDGAVLTDDDETGAGVIAELRALEPELDSFARVPAAALSRLHMDPEGPTPGVSNSSVLADLPEPAIESFLALTGPGSGSSLLSAELRQLGGALSRPAEGGGAMSMVDGRFVLFGVAVAMTPELGEKGHADATALVDAMTSYAAGGAYLNFAEAPVDVSRSFAADAWARLKGIRSAADPDGVLQANHRIPRLYENGLPSA
ncbi:MAG: FAD-binding oxidoreductase [Nocardioidaceae bacterium]|nr:FAD-binding oxidoreductase [Nocardioidaceae bacterium]NUS51304.1 FAD-binding oxidoreductase [Nocardioidaceae bacterium]